MKNSVVLYDKLWYLPTALIADDGKATLIAHRYQIRRSPKNITIHNLLDVLEFANEKEMIETITRKRYRALPQEADGKPNFIPQSVKTLRDKYKAKLCIELFEQKIIKKEKP